MSAGFGIFPPKFHHQYLFHIELLIRISFFSAINEKSGSWPAICNHSRGENGHWLDCELWRCNECYNGKGCFLYGAYIFLLTFNLTWTSLLILFWLKKVFVFLNSKYTCYYISCEFKRLPFVMLWEAFTCLVSSRVHEFYLVRFNQ